MDSDTDGGDGCDLCGRSVGGRAVETDGRVFCSRGCRDVHDAYDDPAGDGGSHAGEFHPGSDLPGPDDGDGRPERDAADGSTDADGSTAADADAETTGEAAVSTFFLVDGMSRPIDEEYLESVALELDGVLDAEASYVTETVRVDHDPDRAPSGDVREALTGFGYTAYHRDGATGRDEAPGGWAGHRGGHRRDRQGGQRRGDEGGEQSGEEAGGRRSVEVGRRRSIAAGGRRGEGTGERRSAPEAEQDSDEGGVRWGDHGRPPETRKRPTEELLSLRYAVGIVFGSFMLLPYVVFLYPVYLAPYVGGTFADLYGSAFENGGAAPIMPVFAVVTGIVVGFTGLQLLRGGYLSLRLGRPTTDLLASITILSAYCYSILAMAVGRADAYFDLVVVVAGLVTGVALYEAVVKRRALDRLTDLTVSQVDTARRYDGGATTEVAVADLAPGDRVLVREGERIPVDGTLVEGRCTVDEAVVTGDSLPVLKLAGEEVVGGSLVTGDAAVVEVGDRGSTIDRLTTALWRLQSAESGIERRADALAGYALPVVVLAAAAAAGWALATGGEPSLVARSALLALVVTSPWALGLATPLSVATGIESALRRGIVVLDDTVFERLRDVDVVVFDKTGTLTAGRMEVLEADAPADLLAAVGALERRAAHPAAEAIARAFGPTPADGEAGDRRPSRTDGRGGRSGDSGASGDSSGGSATPEGSTDAVASPTVRDFRTHAAGAAAVVDGASVLVGHPDLFESMGWTVPGEVSARVADAREAGRLPVVVGRDGRAEGVVVVGDQPREGWASTVAELSDRGIEVVVLTGDDAADPFGDHPAVDRAFAGVPPAGKTAAIRRIRRTGRVAMVGDGTNDAPALAAADLGIALGGGTALASDAADLAVERDDLGAVTTAFDLATAAGRRGRHNLALAFVYNAVAIPLVLAGHVTPLFVAGGVLASAGLIAANSYRPLLSE